MQKVTVLYGHPTDPEAFEKYYRDHHMPLVAKMKGIAKVELTKMLGAPDGSPPDYYRMAELYFADAAQMQATMGSPEGQATAADLANFATGGAKVVIGTVE
jgi:uncharacterized protein (TIGR02118 family)